MLEYNQIEDKLQLLKIQIDKKDYLMDQSILSLSEIINSSEIVIPSKNNQIIRDFFDSCSKWILNNFSSPKLSNIIGFISLLITKMGYSQEISKNIIYSIISIEKNLIVDQETEDDETNKENILSEKGVITNQFLSAFYALIVTISNKVEIIVKSKSLLKTISIVLSQICEIDSIALYYKKKRLISVFSKILKEMMNNYSEDMKESLYNVSSSFLYVFAKIGRKRPIYIDYMFKKGIPDLMCNIFLNFFQSNSDYIQQFCTYMIYSIRTSDHKTFFWAKGIINIFVDNANKDISIINLEYIMIALCEINKDCCKLYIIYKLVDIQCELVDLKFLEVGKELMMKYTQNPIILFSTISILRRIKDKEFMTKMTEELLLTFFALVDHLYVELKEWKLNKENKEGENNIKVLIMKEIIALLGNLVVNEKDSNIFIEKSLHLILIDNIISFIDYPKLIKICVGTLINLSNNEEVRDSLSKVAAFIKAIFLILENYKENSAIIEYLMKLLVNVMKNGKFIIIII